MPSIPQSINRTTISAWLALAGGLVLAATALAILFLPTLQTCSSTFEGVMACQGQSYLAIGGNAVGYTFLGLMFLVGILCTVTFRHPNRKVRLLIRWGAVMLSVSIIVLAGWGFGLGFIPGALLILLSGLLT